VDVMAFDFPPTPAVGTLYPTVAVAGTPQYRWNGTEWTAATFDPAGYLRKSGDAMTGPLSLAGDPTLALHAVPKQYIDAQRQRIHVGGVQTVDFQVPAGAVLLRMSAVLLPTVATTSLALLQISVAPGVFTTGTYVAYGFTHASAANTFSSNHATSTLTGMLMCTSVEHPSLPMLMEGMVALTRPATSFQFASRFNGATINAGGAANGQYYNFITPASGLSVLALRLFASIGGVWANGSYLHLEWL
jgi:hypothetical protein